MKLPIDDENAPLYSVGQAAEMLAVQRAYLRRLDEYDVVRPARSAGGQRRYSRHQIHLVQRISGLASEGIGLAGVRRVLALEEQVASLTSERDAAIEEARLARLDQPAENGGVDQVQPGPRQRTR
ncbi:MAG: MerR family transcriptional regulator [Acidimicrobiales bacterium]